jgi:hypothetical protein
MNKPSRIKQGLKTAGMCLIALPLLALASESIAKEKAKQPINETDAAILALKQAMENGGTFHFNQGGQIVLPSRQYEINVASYVVGQLPERFSVKENGQYVIQNELIPQYIAVQLAQSGKADALQPYVKQLIEQKESAQQNVEQHTKEQPKAPTPPKKPVDPITPSEPSAVELFFANLAKKIPSGVDIRGGATPIDIDKNMHGSLYLGLPVKSKYLDQVGAEFLLGPNFRTNVEGLKDVLASSDGTLRLSAGAGVGLNTQYRANLEAFLTGQACSGKSGTYAFVRGGYGAANIGSKVIANPSLSAGFGYRF